MNRIAEIKFSLISLVAVLLILACDNNELPPDVIAEVEDIQITSSDFKRAYLPILLYSDKKESKATREEVLNYLIDQAILSHEAKLLNLDTVPSLDALRRTDQKTAFTRILYHEWVKNKVPPITETELRKAFVQSHSSLLVRHLFVKDREQALRLHQELESGANWDSLASNTFIEPSLAANGGLLGWIKFGDMDPDFEKAAFDLKAGERSTPVKTKFGWHIIQVDERSSEVLLTEYDYSLQRSQLKRIIRERIEERLADSVVNQMMDQANLVFNPDIAPQVWAIMQKQVQRILAADEVQESLSPELESFEKKLEPLLNEEMLRFSDTRWTVKDFLEKLPEMNRQLMLTNLKSATAFLVRDEIIYREGLKLGLDTTPEVKAEVKDRENQFLANLYLRYQAENQLVSPATIKTFYQQNATTRYPAPDSLYIYELIFQDQALAIQFSKSNPTTLLDINQIRADRSGEFILNDLGWFQGTRADRPDYYHRLVGLPLKTLGGPIKIDNGYTLILASQRHRHAKPLEEIYETVRFDAQDDRNSKLRVYEIEKLSRDMNIRIDQSKLDSLNWRD